MWVCFNLGFGLGLAALVLQAAGTARRITSVVRSDPRSGRLVRAVVVSPRVLPAAVIAPSVVPPVFSPADPAASSPATLHEAVEQIAQQNELSPQLIHSIIQVESNYNPFAISPKGALGLMQLIPSTARRFGVANAFNPIENLQGGARYLKYLLDLYGNYPLALAAYNAGEGAVARYGGVPPYPETLNYLARVRRKLDQARNLAGKPEANSRQMEVRPVGVQTAAVQNRIREVVDANGKIYYISR